MCVKVINLQTLDEFTVQHIDTPKYAVAWAYCAEHGLLSWLLDHALENTLDDACAQLPMIEGLYTWGCGDYGAMKL